EAGEDLEAVGDAVVVAELADDREALGQQGRRLRGLSELDHRRGERPGGPTHLELVTDLAGQVAGRPQPGNRLLRIFSGQRQEPDVLLRERLSANISERGEVLEALLVELARRLGVAAEEGQVPEVDECGRERARRADRARLLCRTGEARSSSREIAL